ncbi:SseB family protein [Amycolatopsis cynarae]|uniref:SseB family protein n=1 Tax=Amycolatopsis cynarae TaxID=2995223 RepID=A0ABY7AVX3_9PSEU|nr:SAV_915 family protein [Amycolatopsis sp. HUAS 11-8]WAL63193.1 SseB family protein [Amycolatopsis sp. HUAS 11-8]
MNGWRAGGFLSADELADRLPERVFVLTLPAHAPTAPGIEIWASRRGDRILLAFSSLEVLTAACGSGQPWTRLSRDELSRLAAAMDANLVGLDVAPPEGHRYPGPGGTGNAGTVPGPPSVLYLASRPMRAAGDQVELELQRDPEGRLMVLAYTSTDELVRGAGAGQGWVAIPAHQLGEAVAAAKAYGVLFNPALP